MNSKAQFGNILLIGVILLVFSMCVIVAHIVVQQYTTASAGFITEPVAQDIITQGGSSFAVWDYGFLFLTIGTFIGLVVSAMNIRTSPIFFFITLLALALELFLIPSVTNIFEGITTSSGVTSYLTVATSYPFMNTIMFALPFILAFALAVFLIVFFGKPFGESGNEY